MQDQLGKMMTWTKGPMTRKTTWDKEENKDQKGESTTDNVEHDVESNDAQCHCPKEIYLENAPFNTKASMIATTITTSVSINQHSHLPMLASALATNAGEDINDSISSSTSHMDPQ